MEKEIGRKIAAGAATATATAGSGSGLISDDPDVMSMIKSLTSLVNGLMTKSGIFADVMREYENSLNEVKSQIIGSQPSTPTPSPSSSETQPVEPTSTQYRLL